MSGLWKRDTAGRLQATSLVGLLWGRCSLGLAFLARGNDGRHSPRVDGPFPRRRRGIKVCHHHLAGRSKRKAASRGLLVFAFVLVVHGLFVVRHLLILTLRLPLPQKRQL